MTASLQFDLASLFIRVGRFEFYAHGPSLDLGTEVGIRAGEVVFRVLGTTVYLTRHDR